MAKYTITPRKHNPGFRVDVVDNDGTRHTVLGFTTEAEAEAWIETDRKLEHFRPALEPE